MDGYDTAGSGCEDLAPAARAFSTVLTTFTGAVINGLTSGAAIAFITAWISWGATLRILTGPFYVLYRSFHPPTVQPSARQPDTLESQPLNTPLGFQVDGERAEEGSPQISDKDTTTNSTTVAHAARKSPYSLLASPHAAKRKPYNLFASPPVAPEALKHARFGDMKVLGGELTWFGLFGWCWAAVVTPLVEVLWICDNWTAASGELKLVRALGISVSALSLTFDTRARYARMMENSLGGSWASVTFTVWNASSCLCLGIIAAALLIKGVIDIDELPFFVPIVYSIFMCVWTLVSYKICPPIDGTRKKFGIIGDTLMGVFSGIFVTAPAFIMWQDAKFSAISDSMQGSSENGASLGEYLSCESVAGWRKFVSVFP